MILPSDSVVLMDLEADGLLREATQLHCVGWKTREDEHIRLMHPYGYGHRGIHLYDSRIQEERIEWLLEQWDKQDFIVAHNAVGFDIPLLKKLYGWTPKAKVVDTLVLSNMLYPDILGGHGLEAWGNRLGMPKIDYNGGWEQYTSVMGSYCQGDVRVLQRLLGVLVRKIGDDWEQYWEQAYRLECNVAAAIRDQEINGWKFDTSAAEALVQSLNDKIQTTDERLSHLILPKVEPYGTGAKINPFTAAGKPSVRCEQFKEASRREGLPDPVVEGSFCRINVLYPDLGSRKQMVELLQNYGWKPTEYTDKGNPKLTEDTVVDNLGEEGRLLMDRFVAVTRRGQVTGWLEKVREDGRIPAGAFPNATPTARMRHRTVN